MKRFKLTAFENYRELSVEGISPNAQKRINRCLKILSELEVDTKLTEEELFEIAFKFDQTISIYIESEIVNNYFIWVFIEVIKDLKREEEWRKLVNLKNYCDSHVDVSSLSGLDLFSHE